MTLDAGTAAVLGAFVGGLVASAGTVIHERQITAREGNRARREAYVEALSVFARAIQQGQSFLLALEAAKEIGPDTPDVAHARALVQMYGTEKIRTDCDVLDSELAELWPALDASVRADRSLGERVVDADTAGMLLSQADQANQRSAKHFGAARRAYISMADRMRAEL